MTNPTTAYPLSWPAGWKRTSQNERRRALFSTRSGEVGYSYRSQRQLSIADALGRLKPQLRAVSADDDYIISTNLVLRLDGLPRSDQREPEDPGVAVYWKYNGDPQSMAVDQYLRVADNLAAVAATLEYLRGIERHGGAQILQRAFAGFLALPAPADSPTGWWSVLQVERTATPDEIKAAYRALAMSLHPDNQLTGNAERFVILGKAYEFAKQEKGF